jgi:hypothetical protein
LRRPVSRNASIIVQLLTLAIVARKLNLQSDSRARQGGIALLWQ